eukprot:scaffold1878_cov113-Isochrysis_galbana.AAC.12
MPPSSMPLRTTCADAGASRGVGSMGRAGSADALAAAAAAEDRRVNTVPALAAAGQHDQHAFSCSLAHTECPPAALVPHRETDRAEGSARAV